MFQRVSRFAAGIAASLVVLLSGCGLPVSEQPPPPPPLPSGVVASLIPASVEDRAGWARDILAALETVDRAGDSRAVCAVVAVIAQESSFAADPAVPNLAAIVQKEMEARARKYGPLGPATLRALLSAKAPGERLTFGERLRKVRSEREVDRIFREMVDYYEREHPLATAAASALNNLLSGQSLRDLNPITTAGSMQVSVAWSVAQGASRGLSESAVRDLLYTRAGGVRYGTARLLGYPTSYDRMLYRFADFNAGFYASRNAALQEALAKLTGHPLDLDGDFLAYDREGRPLPDESASSRAVSWLAANRGWPIAARELRQDLEREKSHSFEESRTVRAIRQEAVRRGFAAPAARLPVLRLESPKLGRHRTTAWFAQSVEKRYRACLARLETPGTAEASR
jgi:hypothetical protein